VVRPRPKGPKPAPRLECRFYKSATGTEPVREWLQRLADEVCTAIGVDVSRVQWQWPVGKPLVGSFGEGLYEVRTSYDDDIYRVFFCVCGRTMVLLHGFQKKTQKTPDREIALARRRQKDVEGTG
jgi:phage-related protein